MKIMCNVEKFHELYEECKKLNFDESSELVEQARSAEEAEFFARVSDIILQQKQRMVIAEKRF